MVIMLFGEDTYQSRERLRVLVNAFKEKYDPSGINISRFSGSSVSFDDVQAGFSSVSFLATKRMIVFEDFFSAKSNEAQKNILNYLVERDSGDAVIIFWQSGALPGQSGRVKIAKDAKKEEFILVEGGRLTQWIRNYAKRIGLSLSPEGISLLHERVSSDLWSMKSILDQLQAYTGGERDATAEDVLLFTESVLDENIFHFTDAIAAKEETRALELLVDQLQKGNHPLYLLTMLIRQFRLFLQLSGSVHQTPQSLGVHPYVFQKASASVSSFSPDTLRTAYQQLETIDAQLKHGEKDALTLFTRFVRVVTR